MYFFFLSSCSSCLKHLKRKWEEKRKDKERANYGTSCLEKFNRDPTVTCAGAGNALGKI